MVYLHAYHGDDVDGGFERLAGEWAGGVDGLLLGLQTPLVGYSEAHLIVRAPFLEQVVVRKE